MVPVGFVTHALSAWIQNNDYKNGLRSMITHSSPPRAPRRPEATIRIAYPFNTKVGTEARLKSSTELKSRPESPKLLKHNSQEKLGRTRPARLLRSDGRRGLINYCVAPFGAAYYFHMNYRSGPSDLACVSFKYLHESSGRPPS